MDSAPKWPYFSPWIENVLVTLDPDLMENQERAAQQRFQCIGVAISIPDPNKIRITAVILFAFIVGAALCRL